MTSFVYTPINSANGEIRILTIEPAKKITDEIHCKFIDAQLDERPVFITLDARRFPVFENLFAALLRLRHPTKNRTIWIDAVCINQGEYAEALEEKGQQLFLMKRIYESAQRVVIWLGETSLGEGVDMKTERKFGLGKGLKNRMSQSLSGEWDARALEMGEIAQLLDRKWWRRVWIVQEVVLAKKAVIMCGPDVVPWENIGKRLRSGMYGILGQDNTQLVRRTKEGSVIAKYTFPDAEYRTLVALQDQWRSQKWNQSIYSVLYTFRRYEATDHKDRIYAFLGLLGDKYKGIIKPDYSATTSRVYTNLAKNLIVAHKHLLIFNLKREFDRKSGKMRQQSQIYSLLDQIRYIDPNGLVVQDGHQDSRRGWARLPYGWERRPDGTQFCFENHLTGENSLLSPLIGQPPTSPQHMHHWTEVPTGWTKTWDNVGRAQFVFDPDRTIAKLPRNVELDDLPSWVPDWTQWSPKDPEPLLSLTEEEPLYHASGKSRKVLFSPDYDSDSARLELTGVSFDKIASLAQPWCPESHLLPIDRLDNTLLQSWEALATTPVSNCPYKDSGGRYNAYWRTHIADYPDPRSATEDDKNYFETWVNREQWASRVLDSFSDSDKTNWQKNKDTPREINVMNNMSLYMLKKGYLKAAINPATTYKILSESVAKYKATRDRIHSAAVGRAMFVTAKGFIGLAPWNAEEGDMVSVLFGGNTPFILRENNDKRTYTLVGEAYVYGIMGGELFSGEMGHARLRTFEIV